MLDKVTVTAIYDESYVFFIVDGLWERLKHQEIAICVY